MASPRLLDLFCCEGGAAMGYHRAGFDVVGVDVNEKALRRYPFESHRSDALEFLAAHGHEFDAIHASPPCKSETVLNNDKSKHEDFLTPTLAYLREVATPWIVENVVSESTRSKMPGALMLCGGAFGLGAQCQDGRWRPLRRHRLFESNMFILGNGCACDGRQPVGVYGNGGGCASNLGRAQYQASAAEAREAIGAPWMSREGVSQSIPPAYTQFLGEQLIEHAFQPAEICRVFHDDYGCCELPYPHPGQLHSRVPGGATEPVTWNVGSCKIPGHEGYPCRTPMVGEQG